MENTYTVSHTELAAYMLTVPEVEYKGSHINEDGKVYFNFSPQEVALKAEAAYYNSQALAVQPYALFQAFRRLKDEVRTRLQERVSYRGGAR